MLQKRLGQHLFPSRGYKRAHNNCNKQDQQKGQVKKSHIKKIKNKKHQAKQDHEINKKARINTVLIKLKGDID
ncbi:hypothetical protein CWB96_07610 [Pseudoalteromonas citrea]|uniref:Uncharacterized protein n=1 Tax=Pseudoalteromonas citrea TaxID=43655 RepID=A0A5S3XS45_9GAMM|nr:hypothetical protein CWB97_00760 [Pseudoalteromonas citrea]TMP60241.1 hypothetical protein CWB96_07610 [Pseudoalteromonas citrea]